MGLRKIKPTVSCAKFIIDDYLLLINSLLAVSIRATDDRIKFPAFLPATFRFFYCQQWETSGYHIHPAGRAFTSDWFMIFLGCQWDFFKVALVFSVHGQS